jgi:hypothetical protein
MTLAKRIAAKRAEQQREFFDVEEWGEADQPLRLYFTQVSARDIEKIQRKYPSFLMEPTMSSMVEMIILKSEGEDGEKLFTLEDKSTLLGEVVNTIAKVFGAVFGADTAEQHEKN